MAARKLTQPEMVLISMYRFSKGTTTKIPYEELVLQAWRDFPEAFSLRNYPEYPDASDIHKKLYGGTLKNDGLVVSLGDKNFRLTEKGIVRAEEIFVSIEGHSEANESPDITRLARDEERFIESALRSRPFRTWISSGQEKLTDYDVRVLFQFSTGTRVSDRKRKADFAKEAVRKAKTMGVVDADQLESLIDFLVSRFDSLFKEKAQ